MSFKEAPKIRQGFFFCLVNRPAFETKHLQSTAKTEPRKEWSIEGRITNITLGSGPTGPPDPLVWQTNRGLLNEPRFCSRNTKALANKGQNADPAMVKSRQLILPSGLQGP